MYNQSGCQGDLISNFTNADCSNSASSSHGAMQECVATASVATLAIFGDDHCTNQTTDEPYLYLATGRCVQFYSGVYTVFSVTNGNLQLTNYTTKYCNVTSADSPTLIPLNTCARLNPAYVIAYNKFYDGTTGAPTTGGGPLGTSLPSLLTFAALYAMAFAVIH